MTTTETLIAALARPRRFHDRHEERTYLRAVETARRILDDPSLLAKGAERMVRRLLADSDEGRALRASSPVFVTFTPEELRALWSAMPA